MKLGNIARILIVSAAVVVTAASGTSQTNAPATNPQYATTSAPPAQPMDPSHALGLWKSNFGGVKIEVDNSKGGLGAGAVQGVWEYPRNGQQVIGYFFGNLSGNVLQFRWQEPQPNGAMLQGTGYIQFDGEGRQFSGHWWTERRDGTGDWNGWRAGIAQGNPYPSQYPRPQQYPQQQPYGQQQPYPQQQPYQPQQQPYQPQQQPYQPQPQQQPYQPQPYPPQQQPYQPQPQQPPQQQPYQPPQQQPYPPQPQPQQPPPQQYY